MNAQSRALLMAKLQRGDPDMPSIQMPSTPVCFFSFQILFILQFSGPGVLPASAINVPIGHGIATGSGLAGTSLSPCLWLKNMFDPSKYTNLLDEIDSIQGRKS